MRKQFLIISVMLCAVFMMSTLAAYADISEDGVLTLEEAKQLALKNNIQYNQQDDYIRDATEKYEEVLDDSNGNASGRSRSSAEKASAYISQKMSVENAYSSVRKAIFEKDNMKRASDYEVTNTFYNVIKAEYSLRNAEADLELKKTELDSTRIKFGLGIIPKSGLSQAETAYASSVTECNKALTDFETSVMKLEKCLGTELDISRIKLDKTFNIPNISNLDMSKIKEGYLKNDPSCFSAKEQYDLAEYKLLLTEDKYEGYYEDTKHRPSDVEEQFDNMVYDARRAFDDVEYSYNEKLDELDETLKNKHSSLEELYESYEIQMEEIADARGSVEENKIKHGMGLIKKAELDSSIASLNRQERQLETTIMNLNLQYLDLTQYSLDHQQES